MRHALPDRKEGIAFTQASQDAPGLAIEGFVVDQGCALGNGGHGGYILCCCGIRTVNGGFCEPFDNVVHKRVIPALLDTPHLPQHGRCRTARLLGDGTQRAPFKGMRDIGAGRSGDPVGPPFHGAICKAGRH